LIGAPGNRHTLGIRILGFWLATRGIQATISNEIVDISEIVALVSAIQPRVLLISIALPEQAAGVIAIVERVLALPGPAHPRIIVGGYAVKQGLIPPIPGADLMADVTSLSGMEADGPDGVFR
jgi:hypothetical protein